MRIEFECSGGYGGLFAKQPLSYRVESEDLPEEMSDKLLQLIGSSGLLDLDAVAAKPGPARDTFTYKLSLRDRTIDKRFTFDDVSAPPAVRPLLNFLKELALGARQP
jgi:hypothetical protein